MSYSITISGHKNVESPEEAKAFEESVVEKAQKFVDSLEGVTWANLTGGNVGSVNLMPREEA